MRLVFLLVFLAVQVWAQPMPPTNSVPSNTNAPTVVTNAAFAFYGTTPHHLYGLYRASPSLTNEWELQWTFMGTNGAYVVNVAPTNTSAFYKVKDVCTVATVTPTASIGTVNPCPGSYIGYCQYATPTTGWRIADTNLPAYASDPLRTDTKVIYVGRHFQNDCAPTSILVPLSASHPADTYSFSIYFSNNLPTGPYDIHLVNFLP